MEWDQSTWTTRVESVDHHFDKHHDDNKHIEVNYLSMSLIEKYRI